MADLTDLDWWLGRNRAGVASSPGTLPPAMPGQTPRLPPPVSSPFSDVMGSPAFQLGYPLAAGIVSGLFPNRGGRAVAGLTAGLNTANYFNQLQRQQQELAKQEQEKQILGDKLGEYLNAEKFVTPRIDPSTIAMPPEEQTGPEISPNVAAPTNKAPVVPDSAHKSLAQALIAAGQPAAALKFIEAEKEKPLLNVGPGHSLVDPITLEPKYSAPPTPMSVRPGGSLVNPATGASIYTAAEAPRPPMSVAPGHSVYDVDRGVEVFTAPEKVDPLEALKKRNLESQIGSRAKENEERQARINKINSLVNISKDPKATAGQLSSAYNALIRDRDSIDTPEEDKPVLNEAIRGIRNRLAELGRPPGGGQPAAQPTPAAAPPGKPIGKTKDGKIVYLTPDGKRVVED